MARRFSTQLALGAFLGSTALLVPLACHAEGATAAPPQAVSPASPAPPPSPSPMPKAATPAPGAPVQAAGAGKAKPTSSVSAYQAFFDAKLAALHAGLELTPDQAPLWPPVEHAIRAFAKAHGGFHHAGFNKGESDQDPLQRLTLMSEHLIKQGQAMKALTDATAPLVATLGADQKERLPQLLDGMQPRRLLFAAFDLRQDEGAEAQGWRRDGQQDDRHGWGPERDHDQGAYRQHGEGDHGDRDYADHAGRGSDDHGYGGQGYDGRGYGGRGYGGQGPYAEAPHDSDKGWRHGPQDDEGRQSFDGYRGPEDYGRGAQGPHGPYREGGMHHPQEDDDRT